MLKGIIAGIAVTIAAALVGGYILIQSGFIPANADATPGPIETWIARTSLDATLNREAPKDPNPIAMTDKNLIDGINLYAQHCAICHGTKNGSASASPVAKGLYPNPLNWRPMALRTIPRASRSGRSSTAFAGQACPRGRIPLTINRFGRSPSF